ncbi:MAG: hypothetical protein ACI97N_000352 [Cognaticolwellia sp.]|jgi:hypothetical protein
MIMVTFTFLMLFSAVTFAQKKAPKIEKNIELLKAIEEGFDEEKGITSYTVMSNILQKDETKQVRFNVEVDRVQKVLIEIFSEEGELVEVIFNDYVAAEKKIQFLLNAKNWDIQLNHYLSVTTEDYIENHELIFN